MISMPKYKKASDESELQYTWRICSAKDSGELDSTWDAIAELLNTELGNNFGESVYRKKYSSGKLFLDEVFSKQDRPGIQDFYAIEKEKVKMRDERNELKRIIREQARKESLSELIYRVMSDFKYSSPKFDDYEEDGIGLGIVSDTDSDLLISLTDIHAGIVINNIFNQFDTETLKRRLDKYRSKIVEIRNLHNSTRAYIVLSELVSGIIHNSLRIEANQNVIEQFLTVSKCISDFLYSLSGVFDEINVYVCPGNHSRVQPKKEDNAYGENFDNLAIPFLKATLQNVENIHFHGNYIEKSMATFTVRGKVVYAVHGDKDNPDTVVKNLTMQTDNRPDIILMGHRHVNSMNTSYDVKVLQAGSVSGTDNYCLDHRLRNKPEQLVAVITDDGFDCLYDVTLD